MSAHPPAEEREQSGSEQPDRSGKRDGFQKKPLGLTKWIDPNTYDLPVVIDGTGTLQGPPRSARVQEAVEIDQGAILIEKGVSHR